MSPLTLPAFLTRRREDKTVTDTDTPIETQARTDDNILMRFLTQGGAVVELRRHEFKTNYTHKGRPYVGDEWYPVNGFRWECLGCGKVGGPTFSEHNYLPDEGDEARDDANEHATSCRAMPKPEA
jgi:hypothetical protein